MSMEKSKFKLEQDAGKFSETPSDFNPFSQPMTKGEKVRGIYEALGFENPATPERKERLEKIAKAINQSLKRYGLDAEPHNPDLIFWDPIRYLGSTSDPWGALSAGKINQVHIKMFLPAITEENRIDRVSRIKDEDIGYIYAHELIHLSSARTWMLEEEEGQKKERLSRLGLYFQRNGVGLWQWVNEGMTDDLTRQEYPQIENYPGPENPGYDFYIEQFNAMTETLAEKNGQELLAVKETFRSSAIGSGGLLPLRKMIRPPFKSLLEFIKITDSPMNFPFSTEGTGKVFNKLWQEIKLGQTDTYLQSELKAMEERLLAGQELMLEAFSAHDSSGKSKFKDRVRAVIEKLEGLDWLLGKKWTEVKKFLEEGEENIEHAKLARRLLGDCFPNLSFLTLMASNPEIKNLTRNKKPSDIDLSDVENLYLKGLKIE